MSVHVVDASTMGPVMLSDEAERLLPGLMEILIEADALVPQHWRLEVANMCRVALRQKRLTEAQLDRALLEAARFPVTVDQETQLHAWSRTTMLAAKHDLTVYDAAYLELALRAAVPLATLDGPLARAAVAENHPVLTA